MTNLNIQPTIQAQWYELIHEAHLQANVSLSDDLESYLVTLMIRFTEKPEFIDSVVAMEYLKSQQQFGEKRREQLRNVGDKCLLFSGLFPGRASHSSLKISHFVHIGQSAYGVLSDVTSSGLSELFRNLSYQFITLMDVLQVIRDFAKRSPELMPLEAYDLWMDTGSKQAKKILEKYSSLDLIILKGFSGKH